jgi:hypothetical protein
MVFFDLSSHFCHVKSGRVINVSPHFVQVFLLYGGYRALLQGVLRYEFLISNEIHGLDFSMYEF